VIGISINDVIPDTINANTIHDLISGAGGSGSPGGNGGMGGTGGTGGNAPGVPLLGGEGGGGGIGGMGNYASSGGQAGGASGLFLWITGIPSWPVTNNDIYSVTASDSGNGSIGGNGGTGGTGGPAGSGDLGLGIGGSGGNGGNGGYGTDGAAGNSAQLVYINDTNVNLTNNTLIDVSSPLLGGTAGTHGNGGLGGSPGSGNPPGISGYTGNTPTPPPVTGTGRSAYGVYAYQQSTVNVYNNILLQSLYPAPANSVGIYQDNDTLITADYNDLFQWSSPHNLSIYGTHNISIDPLFEPGTHQLTAASPCLNTGSNSAPAIPTQDHDGNRRPFYIDDIGAYERVMQNFLALIYRWALTGYLPLVIKP
jgi:hypothetical protein